MNREQRRHPELPGDGPLDPYTGLPGERPSPITPAGEVDQMGLIADGILRERESARTSPMGRARSSGALLLVAALGAGVLVLGFLAVAASHAGPSAPLTPADEVQSTDLAGYVTCDMSQNAVAGAMTPSKIDVYTTTGAAVTALRLKPDTADQGAPIALPAGQQVVVAIADGTWAQPDPGTDPHGRMIGLYSPDGTALADDAGVPYEGLLAASTKVAGLGTAVERPATRTTGICVPPGS